VKGKQVREKQEIRGSETNYILSDEQSCFRPDHSCLDHLFVICSVIGARKLNKLLWVDPLDQARNSDRRRTQRLL